MEILTLCMQIILNSLFHTEELLFTVQIIYRFYTFLDEDFFEKKNKNTTTLPLMCLCFFTTQPLYSLGHISKASPKDMDTCTRPVCRLWGQCIHSLIQQAWWVLDLITNFVWQATLSTIVKILKYEWIGPWALQLEYLTVPVLIVSDSPNVGEVLSD